MKSIVLTILLVTIIVHQTNCSKILVVFPVPSKSHYILGHALAKGLAETGRHDVTMVSAFEEKTYPKRYRNVLLTGLKDFWQESMQANNFFEMEDTNPFLTLLYMGFVGHWLTTKILDNPAMETFLKSDEQYDVVIVEQFFCDAIKGLADHYKAPLIVFSTIGHISWINNLIANPAPPSYVTEPLLGYTGELTFKERIVSWLYATASSVYDQLFFYPSQNRLMKKYFPNAPHLDQLNYNASIIFANSHESVRPPVPHVPNLIDIGGFHLNPPNELPKDLKEFMDSATEGVVYFSMGSVLKPSDMSQDMKNTLLTALGKLKQRVLWKWDEEDIPGKPDNVKLSKWFPQQDVLAHPNTKLFITHGGLLSTTETIYYGVPVLGFPIFGDQKTNALRAQTDEYGLYLPLSEITVEKLTDALNKLLNDPKYRNNAKWRSKLMHDRPVKPMDLAIYWTEYVIRHRGTPHLRVAGVDLPFYIYFSLDVISFVIIISVVSLVALYFVIRKICCRRKKSSDKLKKN